jgi:hypothetical protein
MPGVLNAERRQLGGTPAGTQRGRSAANQALRISGECAVLEGKHSMPGGPLRTSPIRRTGICADDFLGPHPSIMEVTAAEGGQDGLDVSSRVEEKPQQGRLDLRRDRGFGRTIEQRYHPLPRPRVNRPFPLRTWSLPTRPRSHLTSPTSRPSTSFIRRPTCDISFVAAKLRALRANLDDATSSIFQPERRAFISTTLGGTRLLAPL